MEAGEIISEKVPMIEAESRRLHESITRLESLPSAYDVVLSKVTMPATPDEKENERATLSVDFAEELRSYADRINYAVDKLFSIRDRVEL